MLTLETLSFQTLTVSLHLSLYLFLSFFLLSLTTLHHLDETCDEVHARAHRVTKCMFIHVFIYVSEVYQQIYDQQKTTHEILNCFVEKL